MFPNRNLLQCCESSFQIVCHIESGSRLWVANPNVSYIMYDPPLSQHQSKRTLYRLLKTSPTHSVHMQMFFKIDLEFWRVVLRASYVFTLLGIRERVADWLISIPGCVEKGGSAVKPRLSVCLSVCTSVCL